MEIEPAHYVFRGVFINKDGETEADLWQYYVKDKEDLNNRLKLLNKEIMVYKGAKSVIKITYKIGEINNRSW